MLPSKLTQKIKSVHSSDLSDRYSYLIGIIQVVCAAICWGTLGIFSTYLGKVGFTGWQISILRVVTAGGLILVLLPSLLPTLKQLNHKQWLILSLRSIIGVLGMTVSFFFAVGYSGVAMAVALLYTAPVFSLIFAHFLLGEQMTKQSSTLSFLAVSGVALTMAGDGFSINIGVVVGLLSGVCYSMLGILGKKFMQDNRSNGGSNENIENQKMTSRLVFFTSVIVSAVILLFVPKTYSTYSTLLDLSMQTWAYVFGISAFGTIVPFFLYMSALSKLPATKASVFTIFEPLTAIVLSIIILHQSLSLLQGLGVGLIMLAALLNGLLART